MNRVIVLLCLVAATCVWAAAPAQPLPQVKSAAEIAWEAIPDTIPDAEQVRLATEYLNNNPNDIPLLRSVQNILNRKGDLTVEFWKERMDKNPTTANRYLYARKVGESDVMKAQAELIMADDPNNFWGFYLAAVSELNKEKPDLSVSVGFFEQAIARDPSRPEGWYYCADTYEQLKDFDKAIECYRAGMIVDPNDKSLEMSIMGIYAKKRDADKYFESASKILKSDPPINLNLERYNTDQRLTNADLKGDFTVLEVFAWWCNPCVNHALPAMNKLASEGKLPFNFYPVHAEGKNSGGLALMDSNDVTGRDWALNFVFSTEEFNKRLGVTAYPSYYILDKNARPVAMLVGHGDDTIDLLEWLIIQAKKRS